MSNNDERELKLRGNKVKKLRQRLGLSQLELAIKIGYNSSTSIAKIEAGSRDITLDKIKILAKTLGTTPAYLMNWSNDEDDILEKYKDKLTPDHLAEIERIKTLSTAMYFNGKRKLTEEENNDIAEMLVSHFIKILKNHGEI